MRDGRDFPLTEFRGRESAATEAVGYGKALMGFHMVRRHLGDAAFRKLLSRFYADFRGRRATFDDFRATAEAVSGKELAWLFDPWVTRAGAAELALGPATVAKSDAGWTVSGTLRQVQQDAPFALEVPIAVVTEKGTVRQVVKLDGREARFEVATDAEPLGLAVDPQFDVFRKLDPREIPPSIGQLFGEPKVLAVLPSGLAPEEEAAWRALLKGWETPTHVIEVKAEADVANAAALPADRAVWVVGKRNRQRLPLREAGGARARREGPHRARREGRPRGAHVRLRRAPPRERREGRRLALRRAGRRAPRSGPQAPPLRQVLVRRVRRAPSRSTS